MPTHHLWIRDIYPETLSLLQRIYRYSRHHQVRQRAHCLILRHEGYSLSDLITIFKVSRKTLYNWLEAWDKRGFPGLYNRPGRGRKGTFTSDQKEQIHNWAQARINSDVVIHCIETFFPAVNKRTVIVMDQAPIHTSTLRQK